MTSRQVERDLDPQVVAAHVGRHERVTKAHENRSDSGYDPGASPRSE
jgi:hypothetical protein